MTDCTKEKIMNLQRRIHNCLKGSLLFTLLLAGMSFRGFGESGVFPTAPLNPAFVEYMEKVKAGQVSAQTAGTYGLGHVPAPFDASRLKGKSIIPGDQVSVMAYPAIYDLRALGRVTSVKNQGSYGTCWAFATYGSLESWLLTSEGMPERDFSENNMANLHGFDSSLGGFVDPNKGGNGLMATAYLARWDGPVYETDDPYGYPGASSGAETRQRHVQNVIILPPRSSPTDNDNIKYAVTNYGAVSTSMYMDYLTYYNGTYYSYYYAGSEYSNHGVAIVGWNDNFSRHHFNTTPPGDGAFIVKNSWGTSFGESGYFYVSYYDLIGADWLSFAFNNAELVTNYSSKYEYDPLGLVGETTPAYLKTQLAGAGVPSFITDTIYTDRIRFANIFTATDDQNITAVSFYALNLPMDYTITVRTGVTAGVPESGSVATTKSGSVTSFGYQTVVLDTPVPVTAGEKFSVVIRLTVSSDSPAVALEGPSTGYSGATANAGESFTGFEHTFLLLDSPYWIDTDTDDIEGYYSYSNQDINVCIKAFTEPVPTEPTLHVTPTSLDFGVSGADSRTFAISNTGTGQVDWSIGTVYYNQGTGWISSVLPSSGSATDETDTITVTVNRSVLDYGLSTAVIPVSSNGGSQNVTVSIRKKAPPAKPTNVSPANGATDVSRTPVLTASAFSDPDGDTMLMARWRIKKTGSVIWNSSNVSNSIEVPPGVLDYETTYTWQANYSNSYGLESGWSDETSFTTIAKPHTVPNSPINISPANLATGVSLTPLLKANAFSDPDGDTMKDSQWRVRSEAGAYEVAAVWENDSAGATTSIVVTTSLTAGTRYFWQVRYQDSGDMWSAWSEETSFTTVSGSGGDEDGGGGGGGGGCFIATAAYGTPMAEEVMKLRKFRDERLLTNMAGRAFVRWYYRHSPSVAEYISRNKVARALVRAGLRPFLWILSF